MISKVIIGKTFYRACRYICKDTKRAIILQTEGVRNYNYKLMAEDFERQHSLRPTISKAVFHGIISFYPGEQLHDETMAAIATEYLQEMKIINTQFLVVKHIDKRHLHLHILANLVDNNGEAITDSWIGLRGKKIAQKLTLKYKLKQAIAKDLSMINLEALNKKEVNKYVIYRTILEALPNCNYVKDLEAMLLKKKIETLYKYKGQSTEFQGISFKIGNYKYKGSDIDRKFSINNLQKFFYNQRVKGLLKKPESKYSHLLPQRADTEIKNARNQGRDLFYLLMKIEKNEQGNDDNFKVGKKKRRRS
jgi:hypothetical protein